MLLEILLLIVGVPLLWKGAEWLVDGGAAIAGRFGLSPFLIGLTVVSFGTSAPEFVVNVLAAQRGQTELALGTILGSNIANTTLILGIAALIRHLDVSEGTFRIGVPFTLLITLITFVLINDARFERAGASQLGHGDAVVLLGLFVVFMWYIAQRPRRRPRPVAGDAPTMRLARAVPLVAIGIIALAAGGEFLVDGALAIAASQGLSNGFVGFTIVAIGTSLPELAASAAASWKSEIQLVVGNIIGSNIFNLLWILGITALVHPVPLGPDANLLLLGTFGAAAVLWVMLMPHRSITRLQGGVLVAAYVAYLGFMAARAFV